MSNVIKTTGRFEKRFQKFAPGLAELQKVSFSAKQALGSAKTELEAIANLAANVITDRMECKCKIALSQRKVEYTTQGGLTFGWEVNLANYQGWREDSEEGGNQWTFFIIHPQGENIPAESSLRNEAYRLHWYEIFSDGRGRRAQTLPHLDIPSLEGYELCLKSFPSNERKLLMPFHEMYWIKEGKILAETFSEIIYPQDGRSKLLFQPTVCVFTEPRGLEEHDRFLCTFATVAQEGSILTGIAYQAPKSSSLTVFGYDKYDKVDRPAKEILMRLLSSSK